MFGWLWQKFYENSHGAYLKVNKVVMVISSLALKLSRKIFNSVVMREPVFLNR